MKKDIFQLITWLIPITKLRNLFKFNSVKILELSYSINYRKYKKNVFGKKSFFVRNDWSRDELDFKNNGFYILIKEKYIPDLEVSFYNPDIELFGPVGKRSVVNKSTAKIKLFHTGECTSKNAINKMWREYSDNCVNDVDLSMAFTRLDENKNKNYVRLPIWILSHFGYFLNDNLTKDDIAKKVKEINDIKYKKIKFASLIASHDKTHIRKEIHNEVMKISDIFCPGKFLHNDDTLKTNFNNDKIEYLKDFKFNICPENTISDGYITEKLFDAFISGCIPIYSGDKLIEPDIVNKNAILFWNRGENNKEIIKDISILNKSDKFYESFLKKIKLYDYTVDYIWNRRVKILGRIKYLMKSKLNIF